MKRSMLWCAVASAFVLVASGCGGPLEQDDPSAPVGIQWSASTGQCLADQTPISLDGVSSPATCSQLEGAAREGTLKLPARFGGVTPSRAMLCCAEVCTVTPSGMTCSGTVCVRCAMEY